MEPLALLGFLLITKNFLTAAFLGEQGLHFRNQCIWITRATNYRFYKGCKDRWVHVCIHTHLCVQPSFFF